ncbi:hypothetical protein SDC9_210767 [bioreactor metagenome]|uniref:Uncharacterized protein n=1 Tax=bioreactor metagenome TaxID=1076179 RepID=A0A645JUT8_9ZZZZ
MIEHLLKLDSYAYSWLKSLKASVVNNPKSKQDKVVHPVKSQKKASPLQHKNDAQNRHSKKSEKV